MYQNSKKSLAALVTTMAVAVIGTGAAVAIEQCTGDFPAKPLNFQVGYAAGGGTDAVARTLARVMETQNDWVIVVENKPGAGTAVMLASLKTQAADGYSIGVASTDGVTLPPAQMDVGYTYEDFDYIGSAQDSWNGLVTVVDSPFDDIAGLVEHAKKNGTATVSTAGIGHEMLVRQIAKQYDVNLVAVPTGGAAESLTMARGGHVDATIQASLHIEEITSGRMKQLASLTRHRVPYAPDSMTMEEQGVTAHPIETSVIFVVPTGVDADIRDCLEVALDNAINSPEYKTLMDSIQNAPRNMGADELLEFVKEKSRVYIELLAEQAS